MKRICLLTAMVIGSLAMQAQSVGFGLKGGLNLASFSSNGSSINYQNRTGFNGGLFAKIRVSPELAIQPEFVYSTQGTKYTTGGVEHNLRMKYLNIPLMVQAMVGRGFYAEAGPQLGFLSDLLSNDGAVDDRVGDEETGFFDENDFKKTDVALGFGVGYAGVSPIGINARYNLGLTNINDGGSNKIKNNVLQVGLTFRLGGRGAR